MTLSLAAIIVAISASYFFIPNANAVTPASLTISNKQRQATATFTNIANVQGASHTSPLLNQVVSVQGLVTAVARNGFYVQDPQSDILFFASNAIFVYTKNTPIVNVADLVDVEGTVAEYVPGGKRAPNCLSVTQILAENNANVVVRSSSNRLPSPIVIGSHHFVFNYRCRSFPRVKYCPRHVPQLDVRVPPTANVAIDDFITYNTSVNAIDFFESLEGMLVTIRQPVTVSTKSRVGELWVVADNGADAKLGPRGALPISNQNFNPQRIQIDPDRTVFDTKLPDLPVGTKLSNITGVVSYNFGSYEIIPTAPIQVVQPSNLRPKSSSFMPTLSSSTATNIASMNVLNLDPTDSDDKFANLARIIVKNLRSPDVIALQEVQDANGPAKEGTVSASLTLQLLVNAVANQSSCRWFSMCPSYAYIDNEFIGKDTSGGEPGGNIRVAYLYRTDRLRFDAASVNSVVDAEDQQTNRANPFYRSRLPLAVRFVHVRTGKAFEMINVHFSSKGGSAPLFGRLQPADKRQEDDSVNGSLNERRAQAEAVRDYIARKSAVDAARVVMTGDFNEFEFVSPLKTLETQLTLMTHRIERGVRYTFIFQGNAQTLDHFLVGTELAATAQVEIIHVNSEFPNAASDHDPVMLRINL